MNELTIDSLVLKLDGWTIIQEDKYIRIWKNDFGDILKLAFIPNPPDFPDTVTNLSDLRDFYRHVITKEHGAIVEINKEYYGDILLIKTLFKIPQESTGFTYLGSFTLPMEDFCFIMTVECHEYGTTGIRESVVLLISEKLGVVPKKTLDNWFSDPYDPDFENGVLRNLSDDEKYDNDFPNHPLTRTRQILKEVLNKILLKEEIAISEPFFKSLEEKM